MTEEKMGAKTVLITGGAGFIGSHLAEFLLAKGFKVAVLDDLSTGARTNIAHLLPNPRFHFAQADVCNDVVLDRLASEAHTIVHLAAAAGAQPMAQRQVRSILADARGTAAVLNAALRYGCETFLTGASEVLGKGVRTPFGEEDGVVLGAPGKSRWSHAVSKMAEECLGLAYHREYGLPVVIARLCNTVGPRQRGASGSVVPRMMRQALEGRPITVFGDGSQKRCFCDVRDVVQAISLATEKPAAHGQVLSVGGQIEISILDLARKIRAIARSHSEIVRIPYEQAYGPGFEDVERRMPDIAKVTSCLGWRPRIGLDDTLAQVRDWSMSHPETESGLAMEAAWPRGFAQAQRRSA